VLRPTFRLTDLQCTWKRIFDCVFQSLQALRLAPRPFPDQGLGGGLVRENPAELKQLLRGPAESQVELARVQEVAVQGILAVDADAAVKIIGKACDPPGQSTVRALSHTQGGAIGGRTR
jgi:hypothetical protein